ncbi:hypothetical protein [Parapedobacter soli]|uniref:hypothetical protein n=1 Tax=Parapedobacter soli TaxID=416955 RepID=UPI0021C663A4|nr:hypothetical protein [Parapedobacter soli]
MNRFKTYLALSMLPFWTITAAAQPMDHQELQAIVQNIDLLAAEVGEEVNNALKSIDIAGLVSESLARDFSELDWQQRHKESKEIPLFLGYQKEKVAEYSYPINNRQSVKIDNRYGKISVNNWTKKEVKVILTIRTAESSERRAQDALDRVHVIQSQSGNTISFETSIESGDSNWWSLLTSGAGDRALRVDYDIYLPHQNELILTNRYGAIELPDRDGRVDASVSYGSLSAGRLNARGNSLTVAYSKAEVEYVNEADVIVRYGGFTLAEAEKLTLAMSSSGGKIGEINHQADISLRYSGGFEMGLGPSIQKASVEAAYSNVRIRPSRDAAFNFDVAVSYGGFDYDRNLINIGSKSGSRTSTSYSGYWNKAVDNSLSVSARYGAVSLK